MVLIEEVEVQLDFADLRLRQLLSRPLLPPERASGIHLSGVLRHIVHTSRMTNWQRYASDLEASQQYPLIWAMGVMWEEFVASCYPSWVWQPGQVEWNGISMNADGLNYLDEYNSTVIEEAKWTSVKRKTGEEFMQDWLKMQQGGGYCVGYGAELVRWHVCCCQRPWEPVYMRYLVRFEEKDLESTRKMLDANRQGAVEAGYGE